MGRRVNSEDKSSIYSQAISMGLNMLAGMAVFTYLGYWIDQKRGNGAKAFTLVGMFLGLFYGGYEAWKIIRRREENYKKK